VIEILKAPPFATVQDAGFPEGRAWGLPRCGAMDPWLLGLANRMVGNPAGAAAIEWALGPGEIRCDAEVQIAVLGAEAYGAGIEGGDAEQPEQLVGTAKRGATVSITPRPEHRFSYIALAGGISVPLVLGSRSTYLPGRIGGYQGRVLKSGDRLRLGAAPAVAGGREEFAVALATPRDPAPKLPDVAVRVTRGPQWSHFGERAHELFLSGRYTVSPSSDRMGYRLSGPAIHPRGPATLPSEAACPGAVQIPDGGQPIVLMPDGPTVGGYPKLAVVLHADLRLLAQCVPERGIRFREVSLEEARACYSEVP
jgi:biotin-dependent carboxylase-like uncharacterized protein